MKTRPLLSLLLALSPGSLAAQQPADSRWLPWLGCWQVGDDAASGPLVCVRPSSEQRGVEVATVTNGEIVSTRTLVADGQPYDLTTEDCSGSQFASFSADGRRVFLWSKLTCQGGQTRTASAIMAMASRTEWLDAQSLGMDGERVPRVLRYRPSAEATWPAEFLLTAERAAAVEEARLLAASRLSLEDVQETASHVDQEALAAFLIERNQQFDLAATRLAALNRAGVPDEVIDALVAVSYPTRFVIDREAMRMAVKPDEPRERRGVAYGDPYGWGWWGYGRCYGGWGYWSPYCGSLYWASGFGYGGYWPYWYDPYGYYGYWGRPVIVVRDGTPAPGHGRVSGRGYSRGQATGSGTARPRGQPTQGRRGGGYAPAWDGGGRSSGSSGGSVTSGGYSRGSSSGSSGGTAKPKCCN